MLTEAIKISTVPGVKELIRCLSDELRATIGPIGSLLRCTIVIQSEIGIEWLVTDFSCQCSLSDLSSKSSRCCTVGRHVDAIPIDFEGVRVGYCWICTPEAAVSSRESLRRIVESVLKQIKLTRQDSLLLTELGDCWASLEAIYDIHSLPHTARSLESIIDRILARAVGGEVGLNAGLWVELNGRLVRYGANQSELSLSTSTFDGSGLLGFAMVEQRLVVIDDCYNDPRGIELPVEFAEAGRILIAPVSSRHGTRGIVALWGPQGEKPFDSRIIRQTQALATQGVMAIEGDRLYRAALDNELIQQELEIGARMQQMLLIGNQPNPLGFARVASLFSPSQRVGGDFVEFFQHKDHCLDILIGDVMGKGLKASLVGAAVARQFHRTICSLLSAQPDRLPRPENIVSIVHREIASLLAEFDTFVTIDYARIDASHARFEFVDCGHTPILHFQRKIRFCQPLRGLSMPLGFSNRETYEQITVPYQENDLFIFYSDGVTEVRNPQGEFFGLERLVSLVESMGDNDDPELLTKIVRRTLAAFAGADHFDDDLTFVVVEAHIAQAPAPGTKLAFLEIKSDLGRLEDIRAFVRSVCQGNEYPCLSETRLAMLELAVTEAASNIMIHAYKGRSDQWLRVEGEISNECILIRFIHSGDPFDPYTVELPTLDGTRDGGYGVYLIDQAVDEVFYVNNGRGSNATTLIQHRQLTESEA